jgi:hypothetical protein
LVVPIERRYRADSILEGQSRYYFDFAALPGWRAAQWVDDLVGAADLVIIDAAPHAEA